MNFFKKPLEPLETFVYLSTVPASLFRIFLMFIGNDGGKNKEKNPRYNHFFTFIFYINYVNHANLTVDVLTSDSRELALGYKINFSQPRECF